MTLPLTTLKRRTLLAASLAAAWPWAQAQTSAEAIASPLRPTADKFFRAAQMDAASLSPDGRRLAMRS
ncbi:MAG: hypothetical protein K2W93_05530, partial [Burkholderiaceae bacterium]|nr:hypothetical protein [Burkholderiaceae bacterium]